MKYYKFVFRSPRGNLHSVHLEKETNGTLCTQYKECEWVDAPRGALRLGYGLTCFDSLDDAMGFFGCPPDVIELWECKINKRLPLPDDFFLYTDVSYRMLKSPEERKRLAVDWDWPPGTVMTDKVKLIKRIK